MIRRSAPGEPTETVLAWLATELAPKATELEAVAWAPAPRATDILPGGHRVGADRRCRIAECLGLVADGHAARLGRKRAEADRGGVGGLRLGVGAVGRGAGGGRGHRRTSRPRRANPPGRRGLLAVVSGTVGHACIPCR